MSNVTYYTASGQVAFNAVATVGLPVWETPFPDTNAKIVFRQRFKQIAVSYSPLAYNTAYPEHGAYGVPTSSSYYLVAEENFSDERAGIMSFDRVYAAVPTTRYDYTSIAFQYPAVITTTSVSGNYTNITAFGYAGTDRMYINAGASISPAIGQYVAISYRVVISGATTQMNNLVAVRDYSYTSGIICDYAPNFFDPSITVTRQIAEVVRKSGRARPKTMVGRAVQQYDYVMITPNVTPVFTFNASQKFTVNGEEVNYVSYQTVPSVDTYNSWVTNGTFFTAEDDTWTRWRGNIYEKKQTRIVAL